MAKLSVPREFLGAFKKGHRQASREFIDEELSILLLRRASDGCEESKKTLEWLTKFNNEYHKAVLKRDGTDLHSTNELKKDCDARNYARRHDLYTCMTLSRENPSYAQHVVCTWTKNKAQARFTNKKDTVRKKKTT